MTLVYCFEKKGVLRDENDDDSVIPVITPEEFKEYVAVSYTHLKTLGEYEDKTVTVGVGRFGPYVRHNNV